MTDETGGRSLAAPGRDPVSFGTREPLEEMLSEPSLGGWCQALILQSEKRGRSRCGKQLVQKCGDTKQHGVQCGSVGVCLVHQRVCVGVMCLLHQDLTERLGTHESPHLSSLHRIPCLSMGLDGDP